MERQEREKVGGNWSRGVAREKEGLSGIWGDPVGWDYYEHKELGYPAAYRNT